MTNTVLEFIRHDIWSLPIRFVEEMRTEFPTVRFMSPRDRGEAEALLPEADVILGWPLSPSNFDRARRLRWIQHTAAGVSGLLFPALVESPVIVTNGRGLHAVSMAEHTLGVILAFARKLHLARDAQSARAWTQDALGRQETMPFGTLAGSTLGLVGFGAVGSAIAQRASLLGIQVIAVRKHPATQPGPAQEQWGVDRLPELLERSDWLVLAVPATAETKHLIGPRELARMKRSAILINLGRGALVDESALVSALEQGSPAGAALDVFEHEPLPESSPLWRLSNVIVTPHISGIGPRYWERSVELFSRNLHAWLDGRPLENVVDKRAGY